MKFSEQSPSLLLVVTALTALLFPGLLARGTAESSATTLTEPRHTVPGDVINEVRLDLEQQKALGLRTEKLYPERIAARATAFGTVQDPIALTDAVSALHVAEAAMRASSASHRRAQLLHSKRQNVSTQDVERLAARVGRAQSVRASSAPSTFRMGARHRRPSRHRGFRRVTGRGLQRIGPNRPRTRSSFPDDPGPRTRHDPGHH